MSARLRLTVDDYSVLDMALRDDLGLVRSSRPAYPGDRASAAQLAAMRRRVSQGLFTELTVDPRPDLVAFQITEAGKAALAAKQASQGHS